MVKVLLRFKRYFLETVKLIEREVILFFIQN